MELNPTALSNLEVVARSIAAQAGGRIPTVSGREAIFKNAFQAFGLEMSPDVAARVAADPRVRVVEQNAYIQMSGTLTDDRQWNIDRIDQSFATRTASNPYVGDHIYSHQTDGSGVYVYVIDGGVSAGHPQFRPGQVKPGPHFSSDVYTATDPCGGRVAVGNYSIGTHGTGVASVIGGVDGVAPGVTIVPVKIADCNTYNPSQLLWWCYGVDWIRSSPDPNHPGDIQYGNPYPKSGSVANMSIFIDSASPWDTTTPISSFENAVTNLIAAGVTVVTSANNQANSNCTTSPARMAYGTTYGDPRYRVISVGGTDEYDRLWNCNNSGDCLSGNAGSNTGQCVDLYAPAHNVRVAYYATANGSNVDFRPNAPESSGTSFAAPIVAGIAARVLQQNPSLTPMTVWSQISSMTLSLPYNFDSDGVYANDRLAHMDGWR